MPRDVQRVPETVIRAMTTADLEKVLPALDELFVESVNGGASLGFVPPLASGESRAYWRSLGPDLQAGTRLLLVAFAGDRLIGSGQLALPSWSNARHRAELQKLFVAEEQRGRGVGRRLVEALHEAARDRGRSLLLLNTQHGEPAEAFYRGLGYREVGVTPGYTTGPAGERHDNMAMFLRLEPEGQAGGEVVS